jgi:hypothetical protein
VRRDGNRRRDIPGGRLHVSRGVAAQVAFEKAKFEEKP